MSESFAALFEQSMDAVELNPGKVVTGEVVNVDQERVIISVGLKSEGVVPVAQFMSEEESKLPVVGDKVEVMLEAVDDGHGNTVLSREKALAHKVWQELCEAHEEKRNVTGIITGKVRGGFMVDVGAVRCFLPGSLVDSQPLKDITHLEGRELDFRVIRVEEDRNNVVLSRRALLEEHNQEQRDTLFSSLAEGEIRSGVVKNMTDYGAFVDLGGIDGLLHITDISWRRLGHPNEVVNVGDEIQVKILKVDPETQRISLGMRQLENDPWENLEQRYEVNQRLETTITQILEFGCFAEMEPGIEGLIHVSEMGWGAQHEHPSQVVKVGQSVKVMILEIDVSRRRIGLSMKACTDNPLEQFANKHQKGEVFSGEVKSITDFGIFVELEDAINGLVHISDLGGADGADKSDEEKLGAYNRGDKVEVVLMSVDPQRQRVALAINDPNDPLSQYMEKHPVGSDITSNILKVSAHSIALELTADIPGVIYSSEVEEDVDNLREIYQKGASITGRIIDVDYKMRRVKVSVKAYNQNIERAALQDYRDQQMALRRKAKEKAEEEATETGQPEAEQEQEQK